MRILTGIVFLTVVVAQLNPNRVCDPFGLLRLTKSNGLKTEEYFSLPVKQLTESAKMLDIALMDYMVEDLEKNRPFLLPMYTQNKYQNGTDSGSLKLDTANRFYSFYVPRTAVDNATHTRMWVNETDTNLADSALISRNMTRACMDLWKDSNPVYCNYTQRFNNDLVELSLRFTYEVCNILAVQNTVAPYGIARYMVTRLGSESDVPSFWPTEVFERYEEDPDYMWGDGFTYTESISSNDTTSVAWTDVYMDPTGNGLMVSVLKPIFIGDLHWAFLGIDISISESLFPNLDNVGPTVDSLGCLVTLTGYSISASKQVIALINPKYELNDTVQFNIFMNDQDGQLTALEREFETLDKDQPKSMAVTLNNTDYIASYYQLSLLPYVFVQFSPKSSLYDAWSHAVLLNDTSKIALFAEEPKTIPITIKNDGSLNLVHMIISYTPNAWISLQAPVSLNSSQIAKYIAPENRLKGAFVLLSSPNTPVNFSLVLAPNVTGDYVYSFTIRTLDVESGLCYTKTETFKMEIKVGIQVKQLANIPVQSGEGVFLLLLSCVLIVVMLGIMAYVVLKREDPLLKAASIPMTLVILVGALFGLLGNFFWILPWQQSANCFAILYTFGIGYTLLLTGLLVKNARVWYIFSSSQKSRGPGFMRDKSLFVLILVLVGFEILIASLITGLGAVSSNLKDSSMSSYNAFLTGSTGGYYCEANLASPLVLIYIGWKFLFIAAGIVIAYNVRNAAEKFNESKQVSMAIYNISIILIIAVLLGTRVVFPPLVLQVLGFLFTTIIFFGTVCIVLALKLVNVYKQKSDVNYSFASQSARAQSVLSQNHNGLSQNGLSAKGGLDAPIREIRSQTTSKF